MSKYITNEEYMNDSSKLHHAYYLQMATLAGMHIPTDMLNRSKKALATGDKHLNSIPLKEWDHLSKVYKQNIARANKIVNNASKWSLSDGVCAAKAMAIELVKDEV